MTVTDAAPASSPHRARELARRIRWAQAPRPRAQDGSWRGWMWAVLLAVDFYWLSNPLVFVPVFDGSLRWALISTAVVALVDLYWIRVPGVPWEIVAFLGFAGLTSVWSLHPPSTEHAVQQFIAIAAIALVIAANVTVRVLVQGLAMGGLMVLIASLYAVQQKLPGAVVPLGTDGYMAGVGTNRIILSYTLVMSLAAIVSVIPKSGLGWIAWVASFGGVFTGVYLSSSGSGTIVAGAVLGLAVLLLVLDQLPDRVSAAARRVLYATFALVAVTAVLGINMIVAWVGRDIETLSGRVPLWYAIIDVMREDNLFTGYGFGGVWTRAWQASPPNEIANRIYEQSGLVASHGHNSLFDLLPQVGLVGLMLCAVIYLRTGIRALRLRRLPRPTPDESELSRFLLVGLLAHLLFGITEPMVSIPLGWFVLVLLAQARLELVHSRPYATDVGPGRPNSEK